MSAKATEKKIVAPMNSHQFHDQDMFANSIAVDLLIITASDEYRNCGKLPHAARSGKSKAYRLSRSKHSSADF